jgi:hypothetical protein
MIQWVKKTARGFRNRKHFGDGAADRDGLAVETVSIPEDLAG